MKESFPIKEVQRLVELDFMFTDGGKQEDTWFFALSQRINEMIEHDFHALIAILYRLDVDEAKLKQLLKDNPGRDAGNILGELIIERQLQKLKSREAFRQDNAGIDENEK